MKFIDAIFSFVWDISDWFYQLYYESQDIPIVGGIISGIFYSLYKVFWSLLTPLAHFGDWVDNVAAKVENILSSVDIISLLKTWLTKADSAWDWILDASHVILTYITSWWSTASQTVQGWIDIAKTALQDLIDTVNKSVATLQTAWDNFRTLTLPTLATYVNVSTLITSALQPWKGLFNFWGEFSRGVTGFFTNPLDWLWERFTDWFLGGE